MKRNGVSWWERTAPDAAAWHYVRLAAETGAPVAGITHCACGRYRVHELTLSPLTAPAALHRAPADAPCSTAMMRSARAPRGVAEPR